MNRIAIILLASMSAFTQSGSISKPMDQKRRTVVFHVLSTGRQQGNVRLTEDLVAEAGRWFKTGDQEVLEHLIDATKYSDGAISAILNITLGNILIEHPATFLREVSKRAISEQSQIAQSTISADGAGFAPPEMKQIRKVLQSHTKSNDGPIKATARLWLSELDSFEKQL